MAKNNRTQRLAILRRTLQPWAYACILFAANAFLCRELFSTTYVSCAMSSVEGSFITMGRYAMDNAHDLAWFPLWFGGMPWLNVYQPGLPISVAWLAQLFHAAPALVYHFLMALFYCLGPVTVFWMCFGMTGLSRISLLAGLIYSLFSPSAVVAIVHDDLGSFWFAHRFQTMVAYGEGPHVTAMTLIPVAVLCFHHGLILQRPLYRVLAPICLSLVAVTNWTGSVGLALALGCFLTAYLPALRKVDGLLILTFVAIAYAIASPWLPPSQLQTVVQAAQHANGHFPFTAAHLVILGLLIPAVWGAVRLLRRLRVPEFLQFTGLFAAAAGAIYLVWHRYGFALLPQPHRWLLEMEMGLIPTLAFAVFYASQRLSPLTRKAWLALVLVSCAMQVKNYRYYYRFLLPAADITQTSEYKEAQWFDHNMRDRRVFAPGSVSLWMNLFTDTPQFQGCCDQGLATDLYHSALYSIHTGENAGTRDAGNSLRWFKAFGVHAVGVSKKGSTETYKPFRNPDKFDGLLPVLWQNGGDVVYGVPQRTASLAHAMSPRSLVRRTPAHGLDTEPLVPYIEALDDASLPDASFQWTSRHSARIRATLNPDQVISVQESYDPRWRATANGAARPVRSDALGMIVIEAGCSGPCEVNLWWDNQNERHLTRLAQWTGWAGLAGLAGWGMRRAPGRSPQMRS